MEQHSLVTFLGAKFIRFGQIWFDLGKILAKLSQIWAKLIRFEQNQNLASSKAFDLLRPRASAKNFQGGGGKGKEDRKKAKDRKIAKKTAK